MTLDYDRDSLPWLDRVVRDLDDYLVTVEDDPVERMKLRFQLAHWMHFGYVVLEGAIEPALIDAYVADVRELFERREHSTLISTGYEQYSKVREWEGSDPFAQGHRVLDFHNWSVAGKRLSLHPAIVNFVGHVLRDEVVMMQSLTFLKSSEQQIHQDFAFVPAEVPSHLCASWIALEDIDPGAGPLCYYPGSHTIPKFDWGDGLFRTPESTRDEQAFAAHIERECGRAGLALQAFTPKKGDVFVWHSALAHGAVAMTRPERTRLSYATHYSTTAGYAHDYRAKDRAPVREEWNGGVLYRHPHHPDEESAFRRGESV